MFIQTEVTPNPSTVKFLPGVEVMASGTVDFRSEEEASKSPLASKLFKMDDIVLSFDKRAIDLIVDKALEYKLGARGLRSICESIMLDAMFNLPSEDTVKELRITGPYTKKQLEKISYTTLNAA